MSQVQIPKIPIIVFDKLELIFFVSQGLTLSTASLVLSVFLVNYYSAIIYYKDADFFDFLIHACQEQHPTEKKVLR